MKAVTILVVLTAAAACAARGPLVATFAALDEELVVSGPAFSLGRVGRAQLFCGRGVGGLGTVILADASGRFYYRVEGRPAAELAPFGEVLFADGGEVLLSRQYGFVYDRPLSALAAPWRRLEARPFPAPDGGVGGAPASLADGRIPYLLSRITAEDIEKDLTDLTAIPTRYSYSPYLDDAAALLYDRFASFGLVPRYEIFITAHDFDSCFFLDGTSRGWLVGASGLILSTLDGGDTWEVVASGTEEELVDVFFYDAARGWVVGANGTVLRTEDGGASWQKMPPPTTEHLTGVHFASALEGWTCGTGGVILHTSDGGATWEMQNGNMTDTLFEIQFLDNLRGYAVGWHGEVRRTDDGGATWLRKKTPFSNPQSPAEVVELTGLSFISPDEGWVVGNHYDLIMYTGDGGDSWDVQSYDAANGEYLGAITFLDANVGIAVGGEEGAIIRTTDGGTTWRKQDVPADYPLTGVSFSSGTAGWACGYGSCIDRTADGGVSWESVRDNLPEELGWPNVVCDITGAAEPTAQYLLTAHYDSVSDEPRRLAPGADDNGSGVVAALAVARAFADAAFARTVRFVLFAGEEQGLVGSRDYARRARARGDDIRGVWNMDMVGYVGAGPDDSFTYYNDDSAWMFSDAARAQRLYVPELSLGGENNPFRANSDHYSFWHEGYAAALLAEDERNGAYPYSHKTTDTMDHLSTAYIAMNARLAAAAVAGWAGLTDGGPALSLDGVRVYPNPYKPARASGAGVTFSQVPVDATIAVYNIAGEKVAAGRPDSGGVWLWDGAVASGVYLYYLKREGERRVGKVAVVN